VSIPIYMIPKTQAEHKACRRSADWRINNLYSVVDKAGCKIKFRQNPIQRRAYIEAHGQDVYLKSRRHGITTGKCIEIFDQAFHNADQSCGIIAHTQAAAWAIFAKKIRMPYESLPEFIRKDNPAVELSQSHIKFQNGSVIRVAVSFQSDTLQRLHVSELGPLCAKFPLRAAVLFSDTFPAVHPEEGGMISVESTAEGGAGPFYDICQQARADTKKAELTGIPLTILQWKFHFFSWQADPTNIAESTGIEKQEKTVVYFNELRTKHDVDLAPEQKAWYGIKKDGAGGLKRRMKQHYPSTPDEAFEQSVDGAVYTEEMIDAYDQGRIGCFPWVRAEPVYTFWDLGISKGNACCVGFVQFIRDQIRIIDYYECENRGMTYHVPQVLGRPYSWQPNEPFAYVPHDIMKRDPVTAVPMYDSCISLGLRVHKIPAPRNKDADGIESVRKMFDRICINQMSTEDCNNIHGQYDGTDRLIKALSWYRYEWDDDKKIWSRTPTHDWASNAADMLQTLGLAVAYHAIGGKYRGSDYIVAGYTENMPSDGDYNPLTYGAHGSRKRA